MMIDFVTVTLSQLVLFLSLINSDSILEQVHR